MTFWASDLGKITGLEADAFAKTFITIPDGTTALAKIEKFSIESMDFKYYQIEWVLVGGEFKGRHVFQKIKALEADPRDKDPNKTRHRALNMLMLIYRMFNQTPAQERAPSDNDLKVFIGKHAGIKIQEWQNAEGKTGNWISEVHSPQGFTNKTGVTSEIVKKPNARIESAFSRHEERNKHPNDIIEDIPF